jgi:hypothetical protein
MFLILVLLLACGRADIQCATCHFASFAYRAAAAFLARSLILWKRPGLIWRTEESANVFERKLVVDGEEGQLKTR